MKHNKKEFNFDHFKNGMMLLKFGTWGSPSEKFFTLSGNLRFLVWHSSTFFTFKIGSGNRCVDMQSVVRIEAGQNTPQFKRFSKKYASVAPCSFSIFYLDKTGRERSLNLLVSSPLAHQYWMDGINEIINQVRYFREHASLDERYLKGKFELADRDHGGTLNEDEVYDLVASLDIQMEDDVIHSIFHKVDADESGFLDFNEFTKLMALLRRRPDVESLWYIMTTVMNGGNSLVSTSSNVYESTKLSTYQIQNDLKSLLSNTNLSLPKASVIRSLTLTTHQFMDIWNVMNGSETPLSLSETVDLVKLVMHNDGDREKALSVTAPAAAQVVRDSFESEDSLVKGKNDAMCDDEDEVKKKITMTSTEDKDFLSVEHNYKLSFNGFLALMVSEENEAYDYVKRTVYQDMTQPLSHYFISTSHNTYCEGGQLTSNASVKRFTDDLRKGCRCLSINCHDGDRGVPMVYNKYTITKRIRFADVITAIKNDGFVASPYPVILYIENHCGYKQQEEMSRILHSILGHHLVHAELYNNGDSKDLPSPEQLWHKVLVCGTRLLSHISSTTEGDSDDENDGNAPVHRSLSKRTYLNINKDPIPNATASAQLPTDIISDINEDAALQTARLQQKKAFWLHHGIKHLSRTHPKASRTDSSNLDPTEIWAAGCQMVALSYQFISLPMHINDGKFKENGSCGYVLKPDFMLASYGHHSPGYKLQITIISAQQLPNTKDNGDIMDPFVVLTVTGAHEDHHEHRTTTIQNNGFNPVWNEVTNPDCAHLTMQVFDEEVLLSASFVACTSIPLLCLKQGWRSVSLFDAQGTANGSFAFAKLFIRVEMVPLDLAVQHTKRHSLGSLLNK